MRTWLKTYFHGFKREVKKKRCVFADQCSSEVNQWLIFVTLEKLIPLNLQPGVWIKITEPVKNWAVVCSADTLGECICTFGLENVIEQPDQRQTLLVNFASTVDCITDVKKKFNELNHYSASCCYSINFTFWFPQVRHWSPVSSCKKSEWAYLFSKKKLLNVGFHFLRVKKLKETILANCMA